MKILVIKINLTNTINQDYFIKSTEFDVEEIEIDSKVM